MERINFTSKISIYDLLIKSHNFQTDQKLAIELCLKSTKSITITKHLMHGGLHSV